MKRWLPWIAAVLALALFLSLGRWQWGRASEKEAMLAVQAQVLAERSPVAPAALAEDARALAWIALEGGFPAEAPPVLLDNQLRNGRAGVRAYRLFRPADGETPVLVELGWLPLPPDRRLPTVPAPTGAQAIEGLLAPPPSAGFALGSAASVQPDGSLLLMRLEPAALADALGVPTLSPRVLRLDPDLAIGYERDLDILTNTLPPEKHRGYAVQWWGLAGAVLVIALVLGVRRRRSPA